LLGALRRAGSWACVAGTVVAYWLTPGTFCPHLKGIVMNRMIAGFAVAALTAVLPPAFAGDASTPASESQQTPPDGSVQWSGGAIAAGIGYTWGDGTLAFAGQKHDFTVSGMSIVDVGATSVSVAGDVYHLNDLSDFEGNYFALSAGGALAGGGSVVYLQNEHGVVIKISATEVGLRFNLAAGGLNIALKA
jgi:hypothetical protein